MSPARCSYLAYAGCVLYVLFLVWQLLSNGPIVLAMGWAVLSPFLIATAIGLCYSFGLRSTALRSLGALSVAMALLVYSAGWHGVGVEAISGFAIIYILVAFLLCLIGWRDWWR